MPCMLQIFWKVGGGFGGKFCNSSGFCLFSVRILCYRPVEVEAKGEGGSKVGKQFSRITG